MGSVMTIEEINSQFESEWMLIEDPQTTDDLEILRGKEEVAWRNGKVFDFGRAVYGIKITYAPRSGRSHFSRHQNDMES